MTSIDPSTQIAIKEKSAAALSSVVAAVGLTTLKIVVGIMTNSLGILAEAAHSGLDLVAALVTYFAVHASSKPPDQEHHYGHGKVENLSALFETFLLLVTCVWIIYEAIQRLWFKTEVVDASIWAFLVMIVSIAVDRSRSRVLYKAAEKHNSQALEADALHFRTDIWSSCVVILGLVLVKLGEIFPSLQFLAMADAIAALVVAAIVVYISLELGIRTVQGLLDQAPEGLREQIELAVERIPGITDCHEVRIRPSGADLFVDMHILVDPTMHLEDAHDLTIQVEQVVAKFAPKADITVHVEPVSETPIEMRQSTM